MIGDLVNVFPREKLKELDLSTLENRKGEDIRTVLLQKSCL